MAQNRDFAQSKIDRFIRTRERQISQSDALLGQGREKLLVLNSFPAAH